MAGIALGVTGSAACVSLSALQSSHDEISCTTRRPAPSGVTPVTYCERLMSVGERLISTLAAFE